MATAAPSSSAGDSEQASRPPQNNNRRRPCLHLFQLHESPLVGNDDYSRFDYEWILLLPADGTTLAAASPSSPSADDSTAVSEFPGIQTGDMVRFPELVTGAGEFEGVYFVGPTKEVATATSCSSSSSAPTTSSGLALIRSDVEYPTFPRFLAEQQDDDESTTSLRSLYGPLVERILQQQQNLSLSDLMGGDAEVEEFWNDPPLERPSNRAVEGTWLIPLQRCTWLSSHYD